MISRLMSKRKPRPTPPPSEPAPAVGREAAEERPANLQVRRAGTVVLLLAGFGCWWAAGGPTTTGWGGMIAGVVAGVVGLIVALLPATRGLAGGAIDRLRSPSAKTRAIVAILLAGGAAFYLLDTASRAGRVFRPVIHDEHVYLIQTRMAAIGRLWMPKHELGDFFDSFHMIIDGVYAGKYGPGTAMLCAPAVWLGWPPAMACLGMTAAAVALLYLILCRTVDALAGVLGVLMLLGVSSVRRVSLEVLSQAPMLFLLLLSVWAVLNWRETRRRGWLALAWAAAGWGVITRPVDGGSLVLALGVAMGVTCWRRRRAGDAEEAIVRRGLAWDVAIAVLALMPFVVVQLVSDKGITGRWFEMPWSYWSARNDPYDTISVAPVPAGVPHRPASAVPRTAAYSEANSKPEYEAKVAMSAPVRILKRGVEPVLRSGLGDPLLLVLVPVSFLGLWTRGRWVLVATLPLFVWVYARHTYFISHYVTSITPAMIVMVLVGWDALAGLWGRVGATAVRLAGGMAIAAVSVATLPQVSGHYESEDWDVAPVLRLIDDRIADEVRPPAVVLFRAGAEDFNLNIEPTYNVDVAWPDDAPIVRAHDLGPERDRQLYAYYAALARRRGEADRTVYLYDLSKEGLGKGPTRLGTAGELAAGK